MISSSSRLLIDHLGALPALGEVTLVAGHQKVSLGFLSTFQEAIIPFIRRNGQHLRRLHHGGDGSKLAEEFLGSSWF